MIRVQNLRKSFKTQEGGVNALNDISFEVKTGTFFTLLGPSGCGKTTTLRSVAGLERPDEGEIVIGNQLVFSSSQGVFIPGNKRNIGMVFQSYAIWPHMTVFKNVAYPLRAKHRPRDEIRGKVRSALKLVGMEELEDRLAPRLSGGQQQRVALARALVAEPHVLLLDEPLSNLDAKLRNQMRWELKDLQSRLGTTTLYVTHDQIEALAISDEIALMNRGKIIQLGTPQEIYGSPVNEFAADFIGAANIIHGELIDAPDENGHARVKTPLGELCVTQKWRKEALGKEVLVAFRPEEVSIFAEGQPAGRDNVLKGEVQGFTYLGEATEFHVAVGDHKIQARGEPGMK
ncbi:MAG: ABC transporter ATP-binding protein, partial [Candidatus Binatia bacterium]